MAQQYWLEAALLPDGWARGVLATVDARGRIESLDVPVPTDAPGAHAPPAAQLIRGIVVPGMPNAHSHAFQRGMTGDTEFRLSAKDSFWTWRRAMYSLASRIDAADLQILATQLFIEMLKSGYTAVAEFHYLHRQRDGAAYDGNNPLWEAIDKAADNAGIALTLLPTLYQTSDFGDAPLKREQARFAFETDQFLRAVEARIGAERASRPERSRTGAAFHSLRAVPLPALREVAAALRRMDAALPLHIHVAEQQKEVRACVAHGGRRPIETLLDTGLLDPHWCLVHATHATAAELQGIAAAGASVCVSITTEANLGDGFFDAGRYLKAGGGLCIGSDSQATVSPAEELRWLEYQQRLRTRRRGVLADAGESHAGTRLWAHAAEVGARALGQTAGALAVDRRADWVVIDPAHPSMAGAPLENALDHVLFAGGAAAIRDVMVAGRWVVRDGRHAAEAPLQTHFVELMTRLAAPARP